MMMQNFLNNSYCFDKQINIKKIYFIKQILSLTFFFFLFNELMPNYKMLYYIRLQFRQGVNCQMQNKSKRSGKFMKPASSEESSGDQNLSSNESSVSRVLSNSSSRQTKQENCQLSNQISAVQDTKEQIQMNELECSKTKSIIKYSDEQEGNLKIDISECTGSMNYQKRSNKQDQELTNIRYKLQCKDPNMASHKILQEIMMMELRKSKSVDILRMEFIDKVRENVEFIGLLPRAIDDVGRELIANGQFHLMWGKILKKLGETNHFSYYYQQYYEQLIVNHTSFQKMFNHYNNYFGNQEIMKKQQNLEEQSTKLGKNNQINISYNESSKNIGNYSLMNHNQNFEEPAKQLQTYTEDTIGCGNRVRLLSKSQSNERRHKMELACFFLGIQKIYLFLQVQNIKIIEYRIDETIEYVVVEGRVPKFSFKLNKVIIELKPQTFIAVSRFDNLTLLLRLKMTYNFAGLLFYQQMFNLGNWLKRQMKQI